MGGDENFERFASPDFEDLTDVFYESEDDLLFLGEDAQERMDSDDNPIDDDHYMSQSDLNINSLRLQDIAKVQKHVMDEVVAVLDGEPVHSLYSRVETLKNKPKIPLSSITPQRRPRPHSLSSLRHTRPSSYNTKYSQSRTMSPYALPSTRYYSRYQRPSAQYRGRNYLYPDSSTRYISRKSWNPQASFPTSLSNSRFQQFLNEYPSRQNRKTRHNSPMLDMDGAKNLNYNHLLQPAPSQIPSNSFVSDNDNGEAVDSANRALNNSPPHYYFNLTSHLIRTRKLDPRYSAAYKSREPRSVALDVDSTKSDAKH